MSPFLLEETERVLNYPRLQALYGLQPAEIQEHIDLLTNTAEIVAPVILEPVVPGDPNDDYVVYTAVDGHADVLCTRDRHFYTPRVLELCSNHGIAVVGDVELLRLLRGESEANAL